LLCGVGWWAVGVARGRLGWVLLCGVDWWAVGVARGRLGWVLCRGRDASIQISS